MRIYPNGCRWYRVNSGVVAGCFKAKERRLVDNLMCAQSPQETVFVVVQPRGKMKWWLFRREPLGWAHFVASSIEPDSLIMRAVLDA
jgi:hypothetical protein